MVTRMLRCLLLLCLLTVLAGRASAANADPVFDVNALLATPLKPQTISKTVEDGVVIEEVRYHSEMDGDKSVDIFGIFCYPEGAKGLPAFVWNQSGLAQASTYFPKLGAKRGYAVLCIDFPQAGYRSTGGYNINSGLELGDDPKKSGIGHGAVALLKAISFLESRPEVDKTRIGMCGSSWGGFFTTLMAGIDPRLKVASAMFGCGGLYLGNRWWESRMPDAAFLERWKAALDPATRLRNTRVPIGWFTGNNDVFYWMPALMESYRLAAGAKHLSLMPNWDHGLPPELDEQVFAFLDVHLQGKPPFVAVSPVTVSREGGKLLATWTFTPVEARPVQSAELSLSYGDGQSWASRMWITLPARLDGKTCSVELPGTAMPYYLSGTVIDAQKFRYSTPLVLVKPADDPAFKPTARPDYEGAEWGGFEEAQLFRVRALGFARGLPVSPDARDGAQSAKLNPGMTRLPPFLYASGLPHRLTCWLKAGALADIKLRLKGSFDGRPLLVEQTVRVGADWTKVEIDCTPPPALASSLMLEAVTPAGVTGALDSVSFRPVNGTAPSAYP